MNYTEVVVTATLILNLVAIWQRHIQVSETMRRRRKRAKKKGKPSENSNR